MPAEKLKGNGRIAAIEQFAGEILVWGILFYRKSFFYLLGGQCRFVPGCSEYAIEAIRHFGPIKGICRAIGRIVRCNPFCRGGYDPVIKEKT